MSSTFPILPFTFTSLRFETPLFHFPCLQFSFISYLHRHRRSHPGSHIPATAVSFPSFTAPTNMHHLVQGRIEESRSIGLDLNETEQAHQKEITPASGFGMGSLSSWLAISSRTLYPLSLEPMGGFRNHNCRMHLSGACRGGNETRFFLTFFLRFITRSADLAFGITIMMFSLMFHQYQSFSFCPSLNWYFVGGDERKYQRKLRDGDVDGIGTVPFGLHATVAGILFIHCRDPLASLYMTTDHGISLDVATKASVSYLGTTLSYPI